MSNINIIAYRPSRTYNGDLYSSDLHSWNSLDFEYGVESDRIPVIASAADFIATIEFGNKHKEHDDYYANWHYAVLINGKTVKADDEIGLWENTEINVVEVFLWKAIQEATETKLHAMESRRQREIADKIEATKLTTERAAKEQRRRQYEELKKEFG